MKRTTRILTHMLALAALAFLALFQTSCTATGGGPGLGLDLINGVCVTSARGKVCYHPGTEAWTVQYAGSEKVQPLTAVRQADGTVILRDAAGGTLTYHDGRVIWPAAK